MSKRRGANRTNQLTRGARRRLMYVENKDADLDGADAWIGWVTFSKTGRTVYYRGRVLRRIQGGGVRGNFVDVKTREEFWVSGVKKRGSNAHWANATTVVVDEDALTAYRNTRECGGADGG